MKKTTEEKAITLIVLIISVIILAMVTIAAAQGDGIFLHAENAVNAYEKSSSDENAILINYLQIVENNFSEEEEEELDPALNPDDGTGVNLGKLIRQENGEGGENCVCGEQIEGWGAYHSLYEEEFMLYESINGKPVLALYIKHYM